MKVVLWGTRGSLATPGPATLRYGGNTSCVEVRASEGCVTVLDAGTGISALGHTIDASARRVDLLLTHLHMDHLQGLGFFAPLYRDDFEVHLWGPSSTTLDLRARLSRFLSPPLFPVRLRDLPCSLTLHDVPLGRFALPGLEVTAALVCHPGPTVGYRLEDGEGSMAYIPDHEPALGARSFAPSPRWTSGFDLASGVDVLVHDAQYLPDEYRSHVGWGHSSITDAIAFAKATDARCLVAFHHDPAHDDQALEAAFGDICRASQDCPVVIAAEGMTFEVRRPPAA